MLVDWLSCFVVVVVWVLCKIIEWDSRKSLVSYLFCFSLLLRYIYCIFFYPQEEKKFDAVEEEYERAARIAKEDEAKLKSFRR